MKGPPKILYIEWDDASSGQGWSSVKDTDYGIEPCFSIGFLVKEDAHQVILAAAYADDKCNSTIAIPKGFIRKRKWIKIR